MKVYNNKNKNINKNLYKKHYQKMNKDNFQNKLRT